MEVPVIVTVEPVPERTLLAFHETVGTATLGDRTFEITHSLGGLHFSFREQVDGRTVIHTLDLNPVLKASLEAIVEGSP